MLWVWGVFVAVPTLMWLGLLLGTLKTLRTITRLDAVDSPAPETWPTLAAVIPARDEAAKIEAAMKAALSSDYPALRIVAVDDRSTDETGAILDRLAAHDPRLTVAHVTETREGWLGKLAALDVGVAQTSGDWLLFTDADVSFRPDALRRVIAYCEDRGLDYLTAAPTIEPAGFFADTCYAAMAVILTGVGRLWSVPDPDSDVVSGMGAFILFRRALFDRSEGLEWLRLEVADDVGMGLIAKRAGGRCEAVNGCGLMRIPWYSGVPEMFEKLQKNWVAIIGRFSPVRLAAITALQLWGSLSGLAALVAPSPALAGLALIAPGLMIITGLLSARWMDLRRAPALLVVLGCTLFAAMMAHANLLAIARGGIRWRGLLYRRADLEPYQRVKL